MVKNILLTVGRDEAMKKDNLKRIIKRLNEETKGIKPRPHIKLIIK